MKRNCLKCGKDIKSRHHNAKRCVKCAEEKKKNPIHSLNKSQKEKALKLRGTKTRQKIADEIGVTRSNLNRFYKANKIKSNSLKYDPKLVKEVCAYYQKYGKVKTREKYTKVVIRSIVERYYAKLGLQPRQKKWTSEEYIEVMRMAGLVSKEKQSKRLNRPNANEGSIKSFYAKKVKGTPRYINGISLTLAKGYVNEGCQAYLVSGEYNKSTSKYIVLWVDVNKHLRNEINPALKNAIKELANFQKKLFGKNYRKNIERYINE